MPTSDRELADIVAKLATAYLNGDASGVLTLSDPDRLPARASSREPVTVGALQPCGVWGNGKLAFASVNVSHDAETTIGQTQVLLVLRKPFAQWQLLAAARDPISNGEFVKHVASMSALLDSDVTTGAIPAPATLLSLPVGDRPRPSSGQRFGTFTWRSSRSEDVVAEIVEFAYHDDARLFVELPARPDARSEISAGRLWTTQSEWTWRIWSVSRAGDVAFSDARTFTH